MSSSRPVYVPSNKRRNKRFHGAFTGGFSAGYFNTVGSKDGWKPREDTDHKQTKEDFMDEQDFNEWGGPKTIREEYNNNDGQPKKDSQQQQQHATTSKLTSWARIEPPPNVGKRLLRVLGWRTGSTAYVPTDQGSSSNNTSNNTTAADASSMEESFLFLSSRRLKKIRLQQSRVKIPEPKLDTCGLGYDVYHGAPEFQAHQEKRKRAARERAKAVTGNRGDNVYRLSSSTTNLAVVDGQDSNTFTNGEMTTSDSYAGFETVEDFVGKRTVGGFAIREDEDDVYDEAPLTKESETLRIDKDQYDTEIYDYDSDDPNGKKGTASAAAAEVKGLFANWASSPPTTTNDARKEENRGVTSDGRPPLTGFVLGGSSGGKPGSAASSAQRYPGPDLPFNYLVTKHQFHPKECPDVLGIQSRLDQEQERLRQASVARQQRFQQQFQKRQQQQRQQQQQGVLDKKAPMAGTSFAGLANAMKNRFTSSTTSNDDTNSQSMSERGTGTSVGGGGLRHPSLEPSPDVPKETERPPPSPKEIRVVRSVMLFSPDVLLCKRLGVTPPKHAQRGGSKAVVAPTQEENYFQTEILKHVETNNTTNNDKPSQTTNNAGAGSTRSSKADAKLNEILDNDDGERLAKETDTRPGMDVYKSIFEPESESDSDAASEADAEPKRSEISLQQTKQSVGVPKEEEEQQQGAVGDKQPNPQKQHQGGTDEATNGQLVLRQPEENGGAGRKRPRGRNEEDDDDDDSDATTDLDASSTDEERRRHRRRKERRRREKKRKRKREEKKRRKKHKSSKKGRTRD